MANDIDMWHDIEVLEKKGKRKEADALSEIFRALYIECPISREKVNRLVRRFEKKYHYDPT